MVWHSYFSLNIFYNRYTECIRCKHTKDKNESINTYGVFFFDESDNVMYITVLYIWICQSKYAT